jgi:hypothetical protein
MTAAIVNPAGYFITTIGTQSHFTKWEMLCKCGCGRFDMAQSLIDSLETLRLALNEPILLTSGVRCPRHNKAVGGEERSWHLPRSQSDVSYILHQDELGGITHAVDISCRNLSPAQLLRATKKPGIAPLFRGRGLYRSWVHVDTRPGANAEWMG